MQPQTVAEWKLINLAEGSYRPPSIEGHGAALINGKVYYFGGNASASQTPEPTDEEIEAMQTGSDEEEDEEEAEEEEEEDVKAEVLVLDPKTLQLKVVSTTGNGPYARYVSGVAASGERLVVFGGVDKLVGWLNSMAILDTSNGTWLEVNPTGDLPDARDKCSLIGLADGSLVLFGGFGPKVLEDEEESERTATFGWFNDTHSFNIGSFSVLLSVCLLFCFI